MTHIYRSYGLTIQSDLPIEPLCAPPQEDSKSNSGPDLVMQLSAQPGWAANALQLPKTSVRVRPTEWLPAEAGFAFTEFSNGAYSLLTYGDGTRVLLDQSASLLWGEPGPGLTHDDLVVYLLGPVMGFILRKRGFSPLHASAVMIDGRAAALVGEAGAGKSTTAAALALRGCSVLCEDVCALQETGDQFEVLPAYPRILLWPDSVEFLFSRAEALPHVVGGWDKRFLQLDGVHGSFAPTAAPLGAVFLLSSRIEQNSMPTIEPLSPKEALLLLVQDTYMNWLLDANQRASEFDLLTRLVSSVACFRISPSADPRRLPELADLILSRSRAATAEIESSTGLSRHV